MLTQKLHSEALAKKGKEEKKEKKGKASANEAAAELVQLQEQLYIAAEAAAGRNKGC